MTREGRVGNVPFHEQTVGRVAEWNVLGVFVVVR